MNATRKNFNSTLPATVLDPSPKQSRLGLDGVDFVSFDSVSNFMVFKSYIFIIAAEPSMSIRKLLKSLPNVKFFFIDVVSNASNEKNE